MVNHFLMKLFNSNDMQTIEFDVSSFLNYRMNGLDIIFFVRNLLVLNL